MLYLLRKIGYLLASLFCIITATFIMMKSIPGDPFSQEQALPPEILTVLRDHYGLNDPWYQQYLRYLQSVVTWDLGPSFKYKGRTVNAIIKEGFPVSAILGLEALALAVSGGVLLGTCAALYQKKWQDNVAILLSVICISVPSFILATLLQYLFAIKLGWLPVARWGTFAHSILPALSLAALPTAFIARLTRTSMLEVLEQDYIKTARSKGLSPLRVIVRHALRNALLPVLSYLGQLTTNIVVGSFIVERIFGIPGLGQWFISSISNRDYTVIMGMTVFYSILLLTTLFLVDLSYCFMDPRIRQTQQTHE